MKNLLCIVGLHRYKAKDFPVTKSDYVNLVLPCDVCKVCGEMRKGHKKHLNEMRVKGGYFKVLKDEPYIYFSEVLNPLVFGEILEKDKIEV